ncbi:MAG TPA: hypothetical protein VGM29_12035 [Polyangiaceae bacterium]|jgi:hypothetical protein
MVRRLPVLQSRDGDDPRRPNWQWILIGAGFVVTLFLPLAMIGAWLAAACLRAGGLGSRHSIVLGMLPVALSFALACAVSGALVGRFGNAVRQALLGGLLGSFLVWSIAALSGSLSSTPLALLALVALLSIGLPSAWLGARLAGRRVN